MLYGLTSALLALSSYYRKFQSTAVIVASLLLSYIATAPQGRIPDYLCPYECTYIDPTRPTSMEIGYRHIATLFHNLGVTYPYFRFFFLFVTFGILAWGMYRFTKNIAFPFLLWTISCFFIDGVQLRYTLASSLVVLAFSFLQEKKLLNYAISIGIILIASQFHSGALFFLPFVFATLLPQKIMWKVSASVSGIMLFLLLFKEQALQILAAIVHLFSTRKNIVDKILGYETGILPTTTVLVVLIFALVLALYFLYSNHTISSGQKNSYNNVLPVMILFSPMTIILMQFSLNYVRFTRTFFIFFFIWVACKLSEKLVPMTEPLYFVRSKPLLITTAILIAVAILELQVMVGLTELPVFFLDTILPG